MRVIHSPQQMQKRALALKSQGLSLAVVPTMGYLHEGHLTLVKRAKKLADRVIVTIFVNPTQFGPREDLAAYPRDMAGDLKKMRQEGGVDCVFVPTPQTMYPLDFQTTVEVSQASSQLCGRSRPGHFKGVTTVVAKLFQITQADVGVFGLKDYQQFAVISQMCEDLNFPIKLVGVPTVREKDGLAMSSRNVYLSSSERKGALSLSRGLNRVKKEAKKGYSIKKLKKILLTEIKKEPLARIDYVECMDAKTISPLTHYKKGRTLFAVAVFFGKTRLIDNAVV